MKRIRLDIVFGSRSDHWYYEALENKLIANGYEVKLHIFSAHRDVLRINEFVNELTGNLIIAGASLSAALPAVLSGATKKPVIGVPLEKNLEIKRPALDAFLAMYSLPKKISVVVAPINELDGIVDMVEKLNKSDFESIVREWNVIEDEHDLVKIYDEYEKSRKWYINININHNEWRKRWKKYIQEA